MGIWGGEYDPRYVYSVPASATIQLIKSMGEREREERERERVAWTIIGLIAEVIFMSLLRDHLEIIKLRLRSISCRLHFGNHNNGLLP